MRTKAEAVLAIRLGLCERIDRVAADLPRLPLPRLRHMIGDIAALADRNGFVPVATIAHSLEGALMQDQRSAIVAPYLEVMRDAVGCERSDPAASETYLAAVSVRLAH